MSEQETQTWYMVSKWGSGVEPVNVTRFTEKSVWYRSTGWRGEQVERRAVRRTNDTRYFPTFEEAKAYFVDRARKRLEWAKRDLDVRRNKLRDAEALKEPTP